MNNFIGRFWYLAWIVNGLLLFGLFGVYDKVIRVEEARAEAIRREIAFHEENRHLLKEREKLLAAWQPHQARLDDFFFTNDRLVAWLEFLEKNARARSLVFEVATLDEMQAGNPARLSATVRGDPFDTVDFLRAVQHGPYGIGVEEGIMRQGASPKEYITRLTFLFHVFSSF